MTDKYWVSDRKKGKETQRHWLISFKSKREMTRNRERAREREMTRNRER